MAYLFRGGCRRNLWPGDAAPGREKRQPHRRQPQRSVVPAAADWPAEQLKRPCRASHGGADAPPHR